MSKERKYWHPLVGFNYRLTNVQAAIGLGQMTKLEAILEKKRQIARYYHEKFEKVRGVVQPPEASWAKNVFWLYSILLKPEVNKDRDELIHFLTRAGVETRPLFYPIHTMPPYLGNGSFPVAEKISARGISLPSGAGLTWEQIDTVVALVQEFIEA
jgi:perosamine synthetase